MRVTNGISLGCPLFLLVHTVNCVQTLKGDPGTFDWIDRAANGIETFSRGGLSVNGTVLFPL
jgi:hypothetical protein